MGKPTDVYDEAFYRRQREDSLRSARAVLEEFFRHYHPRSVVDIGCGVGTWLKAARSLGVADVLGIDGHGVAADQLLVEREHFLQVDLAATWPALERRYGLAISVEVGEHLPASRAQGFVETLTRASDVVLFSAAIPGQGGRHHVNEQFPSYWIALFADLGYRAYDALRPALWHRSDIAVWYRQNLLVFARDRVFPGEHATPEAYDLARAG